MQKLGDLFRRIKGTSASTPYPLAREEDLHVHDVTPFAAEIDLSFLDIIQWAPVWMTRAERLLLFTLAFTLRPVRYLEIGTFQGGSALLVAAALDAVNGPGRLVCIDPQPKIAPEHWQKIAHRTTLLTGYSPDILPRAYEAAGGLFDFVLIDGDHTRAGVQRDAKGVLPYIADGAYLLFHDSLSTEVERGLRDFLQSYADHIVDFGTLTREVTYQEDKDGNSVRWGGLRLMQIRRPDGRSRSG